MEHGVLTILGSYKSMGRPYRGIIVPTLPQYVLLGDPADVRTYIPGGVASGTALIRPDFPELKDFPYLWQQTEYVMGGGAPNYMFLVLAADQVLNP